MKHIHVFQQPYPLCRTKVQSVAVCQSRTDIHLWIISLCSVSEQHWARHWWLFCVQQTGNQACAFLL